MAEIDVSPEGVAHIVKHLCESGVMSAIRSVELFEALASERDQLAAKLAELETDIDHTRVTLADATACFEADLSVANSKIEKLRKALMRIEKARFGLDLNDLETSKHAYWSRMVDEHRGLARAILEETK